MLFFVYLGEYGVCEAHLPTHLNKIKVRSPRRMNCMSHSSPKGASPLSCYVKQYSSTPL